MFHASIGEKWRRVILAIVGFLLGTSLIAIAQVPEETETPKAPTIKKALPKVDEDPATPKPKTTPTTPSKRPVPGDDEASGPTLANEAEQATNPQIREQYKRYAIPFDELAEGRGPLTRIEPYPDHFSEISGETITVIPLLQNGKSLPSREAKVPNIRNIRPYEKIINDDMNSFLRKKADDFSPRLSREDQLIVAEKILAAGVRFHQRALESKARRGKAWTPIFNPLDNQLRAVRQQLLQTVIERKDWQRAGELALRLGTDYPDDPEITRSIYRVELQRLVDTTREEGDGGYLSLREALQQYSRLDLLNTAKDPLVDTARNQLKTRAAQLINEAKGIAETEPSNAMLKLNTAEQLDPEITDIERLRSTLKLKYPILYVAMAELPDAMSPTMMRSEADRRAVELMFESLIDRIPDAQLGHRYRPNLAMRLPLGSPLIREFELRPGSQFSDDPQGEVTAADVRATLEYYKQIRTRPTATGLDLLNGVAGVSRPLEMKIGLNQGLFDPLDRMTFKVMPAQRMMSKGLKADDPTFASAPVGSGPFKFSGREKDSTGREYVVFRRNPLYGRRADRLGLPLLSEIRFFVWKGSEVPQDFRNGRLHLMLDVPTNQLQNLQSPQVGLGAIVESFTVRQPRMIHMLAINHRRVPLQSAELRRAISLSLNRDQLLKDIFRSGIDGIHRPLAGPFPTGTWASATTPTPLVNTVLAGTLFQEVTSRSSTAIRLSLIFNADDPLEAQACIQMKGQIEAAAGGGDKPKVLIETQGVSRAIFNKRVYQAHDYDLAYVRYEYPDERFGLGSLLDRDAAGLEGRNFLGYLADGNGAGDGDAELDQLIRDMNLRRDLPTGLLGMTGAITTKFNERSPFVPLWQLDRHLVKHRDLEIRFPDSQALIPANQLDPTIVFQQVQTWKLK